MTEDAGAERHGAALPLSVRAIIAAGLLGLLAGVLWGVADVPRYTASATVLVTGDGGVPAEGTELAAAAQQAESARVAGKAAGLIGSDLGGADLLSDITASADDGAGAVRIDATADSPDFAAAAANGYALALVKVGGNKFAVGSEATVPSGPSEDRSAVKWGLLGLLAGLLLGALGVAIRTRLDRPAESESRADVEPEPEAAPAVEPMPKPAIEPQPEPAVEPDPEPEPEPVLAEDAFGVPVLASFDDPEDLVRLGDDSVLIDRPAARALVDLVGDLHLGDDGAPRVIAVLDVAHGDGALPVVTGLAAAASEAELRTILVEADLEQPWVAAHLGVDPAPGLRDYLRGNAGPRDVLRSTRARAAEARVPLICVPVGERGAGLLQGIEGERFAELMERLPRVYDLVLVAGPPVTDSEDAAMLAEIADGVILVSADDDDAAARISDAIDLLPSSALLAGILTRPSAAQSRPQSAV